MPSTPTRPKKKLGRALKELREAAGKTHVEAARKLRTDASTVSKYESGYNRPQWPTVEALLTFYDAGEASHARIATLWDDAGQAAPSVRVPAGTPKVVRTLIRAEREAAKIRSIAPSVVPGLLQTADYARAVHMGASQTRNAAAGVEDYVRARLERQTLLDGASPLHLHALLDEAVLHREVGGRKAMAEQLKQIATLATRPNVTVQVIPAVVGVYGSMSGACTILTYDDPDDTPIAYLEHPVGGVWVEDVDDVRHLLAMFDGVNEIALTPDDSVDFIREQARKLQQT
jgi:transcriptional regulator with XRE-family HTH domain